MVDLLVAARSRVAVVQCHRAKSVEKAQSLVLPSRSEIVLMPAGHLASPLFDVQRPSSGTGVSERVNCFAEQCENRKTDLRLFWI